MPFEIGDMSTVELEWIYKGNKLNTIALVSDKKGIVYDNLLYFIPVETEKSNMTESKIVLQATPLLKSGNENQSGSFTYIFSRKKQGYNLYGMRVWEYDVHCEIPFTRSNGVVSINGCNNMYKNTFAALGWNCAADIRKISIVTGTNGHVDFAWAYGYGALVSISIGWNGSGFTISGGGTHSSGEEYISSYYLLNK